MGTAVHPAKTSPDPWNASADVDVFVDEVLAGLAAMAADGSEGRKQGPVRRSRLRKCQADADHVAQARKELLADVAPLIRPYVK